jgi:hypothetical protein
MPQISIENSTWNFMIFNSIRFGTSRKFYCGFTFTYCRRTDKKENQIFLIYKEIQSGEVAKSYMMKGFLIYEEIRKYFPIYEEAVSHI